MSIEKEAAKAFHSLPLQDCEKLCTTLQAFVLGYKTATEELEARKFAMVMSEKVEKQLREQVEAMKCCENCKHYSASCCCNLPYDDCFELSAWELRK